MAILRHLIGLIGILAVLMGLLWTGQGLGLIMWPADSFMLAEPIWALYGSALALLGLALVYFSWRR